MYAGRRDITFAGLVLLIAVCCSTLNALTIPLPNLPPMRNVPFNITVGANEMLNVVVIPRNQKTVPQIQNVIDRTIRTGRATMVESAYIVEYRGVLFWSVKARDDEVEQMAQGLGTLVDIQPNTEIAVPCNLDQSFASHLGIPLGSTDNLTAPMRQYNAPQDLEVVSWPPQPQGVRLEDLQSYAFDDEGGKDTFIYVIENGISPTNPDFAEMIKPPATWYYAPEVDRTQNDDSKDRTGQPNGHGSCVASKAAGAMNGVSKLSELITIKATLEATDIIYAFAKALEDIIENNRQEKSVVVFAATAEDDLQRWAWNIVKAAMRNLFAADAVVVVPAGNLGDPRDPSTKIITQAPAVWEGPDFPLMVVGAVDNSGDELPWSQGPQHVTVWAPGEVVCAVDGNVAHADSGTSFATGLVAGLVAYWLGLDGQIDTGHGATARNVKTFVRGIASWPRRPGGRFVIWNGADGSVGVGARKDDISSA